MNTMMKAVMAAALMLYFGTARALDIIGSEGAPITIGGDVEYTTDQFWNNPNAAAGYGKLDNLIVDGCELTIGASGLAPADVADGDIFVDFSRDAGDGNIVVKNGGFIAIGLANNATHGVSVHAENLTLSGGNVFIGSAATLDPDKYNTLSLDGKLVLDNSLNFATMTMDGERSVLTVKGAAEIGVSQEKAKELNYAVAGATLNVAGEKASFAEGVVLGYGGWLSNLGSGSTANVMVGGYDGISYTAGNILMTGRSAIQGGATDAQKLVLTDMANSITGTADKHNGLSSLIITGRSNQITGHVDASSLKSVVVDGSVRFQTLHANNYIQESGDADSTGGAGSVLFISGDTAKVTGGSLESSVTFTAASKVKTFDIVGTGVRNWFDGVDPDDPAAVLAYQRAELSLDGDTITGVKDAGQTTNIGKFGDLEIWSDSEFIDMNLAVAREGSIYNDLDDETLFINSTGAAPTILSIADVSRSLKFDVNVLDVDYTGVSPAAPVAIFESGANGVLDINAAGSADGSFAFQGMFGAFSFGYTDADTYGLLGYTGAAKALFDGTEADADAGYAAIRPTYGDTVQIGLSDMAYRGAMSMLYHLGTPDPDFAALMPVNDGYSDFLLPTGTATIDEYDSFVLNILNLVDIAAGRADKSTVGLYNGSAAYGVNQVSASTTLTHAQVGLSRSDEVRKTNTLVRNAVSGSDAYAASIMNQCYTNRFWAGGFGLWEDAGARKGFDGYKYESGGVAVGYDRMFGPNFIVGASFAATLGDYEDKTALAHNSDIDSYSFNLYATYTHCSGFFASAFGGYTYSDNDIKELRLHNLTDRLWNTADYHTNSWMLGAKLGYDWKLSECFGITPSAGITWINARSSAHTEYLGGIAVARYGRMKTNQTYLPVELAFGYDAIHTGDRKLNLAANFGYAYNFNNDHIKGSVVQYGFANDTPYAAMSREPGHHTFTVGGGLRYTMGRFDIGAKYDYARKAKMDSHRVYGTVGISF